jgi:hypothetical protein
MISCFFSFVIAIARPTATRPQFEDRFLVIPYAGRLPM